MLWGKEKRGKKGMGRKWRKWHLKYQSESCKYSFHVLSWFGSITCLFKVFQGFGDSGPGTEKGNEKVGEWAERERQRDRVPERWVGELEMNTHLILAQSLDKIKAFARQHITEYRSLVWRSNLAQEHFPMWHQIVPLFEIALLWAVMILCLLSIIWGCTLMLWTNASLHGTGADWCISLIKLSNEIW